MGSYFNNFLSNRTLFFDLFDRAAKNVVDMATLLVCVVNSTGGDDCAEMVKTVDKLENNGDNITHKIRLNLDKIIFTPLNRNDIHNLASAIDDVADTIKEASDRIYLYNIVDFAPALKEIASFTLKASLEVEKAINLLRTVKKPAQVFEICQHVKSYEQQSDKVYYNAVAGLFANEKNAITFIKYREILLSLETSVNKCKRVSDALNVVLINNM
jgi:predicted phosphate transport protein (TIGR00153 family)